MIVTYSESQAILAAILINIVRVVNLYLSHCHKKADRLQAFRNLFWNKYDL